MTRRVLLVLVAGALARGQDRDFLTAEEIDQIRLAQEPNERLKLYVEFARQRIALVEQLVAKEKPGRSGMIHDTLEDYEKIIEAVDTVVEDALKRKLPLDTGMVALVIAERGFLATLKKVQEANPSDLGRYKFALEQAIDTTNDSYELAQQDVKERGAEVATRQAEEKKKREELMTPTDLRERKAAEAKQAEEEKKTKRKVPTLRRKGEAAPAQP